MKRYISVFLAVCLLVSVVLPATTNGEIGDQTEAAKMNEVEEFQETEEDNSPGLEDAFYEDAEKNDEESDEKNSNLEEDMNIEDIKDEHSLFIFISLDDEHNLNVVVSPGISYEIEDENRTGAIIIILKPDDPEMEITEDNIDIDLPIDWIYEIDICSDNITAVTLSNEDIFTTAHLEVYISVDDWHNVTVITPLGIEYEVMAAHEGENSGDDIIVMLIQEDAGIEIFEELIHVSVPSGWAYTIDIDSKTVIISPANEGLRFYDMYGSPSTTIVTEGMVNTLLFGELHAFNVLGELVIDRRTAPHGLTINAFSKGNCDCHHDAVIYVEGQSGIALFPEENNTYTVTVNDMVNGEVAQTAEITITFDVQEAQYSDFEPASVITNTDQFGRTVHTFEFSSANTQVLRGLRPGQTYLLEVWGAQGGNNGGLGGFARGIWTAPENVEQLFINIGEQPRGSGGGGGTDIRTINGNTMESLDSRVIVGGGGGGGGGWGIGFGGGAGGGGTSAEIVSTAGLVGPADGGSSNNFSAGLAGAAGTVSAGGAGGRGRNGANAGAGGIGRNAGGGGSVAGSTDDGGGGGGGAGFGGGGGGGGHVRNVGGGGAGGGGGFRGGNAGLNNNANAGAITAPGGGGNGNSGSLVCGSGGGGASGTPGGSGGSAGGFGGGAGAGAGSGGGGGGWFGGGGGGCTSGGGGGSSFVAGNLGTMSNAQTVAGNRAGHGQARITIISSTINWIATGLDGTDTTNANIRAFIYDGDERGEELENGQVVVSGTDIRFYAYFPVGHVMANVGTTFSVARSGEVAGAVFAAVPGNITDESTTTASLSAPLEAGRINNIQANNPTFIFDFTYHAASVTTLTVSKTVTGSMANLNMAFEFTVFFKDLDGKPLPSGTQFNYGNETLTLNSNGSATFTLRHGQAAIIEDVPIDVYIQIRETPDMNYTTSFIDSENANTIVTENDTTLLPMTENRSFDFTNARVTVPPTGINLGNINTMLPLLGVFSSSLIIFAAGTVYRFKRRRAV